LKFLTVGTFKKLELHQWGYSVPNLVEIARNAAMLVWLENVYSSPFWGICGAHFPQMMSLIVLIQKKTIFGLNHVIWAINRENRSRGSSWACEREKSTGQDRKKVTTGLYFTYLWRSPHWSHVHENLCSGWCSRRNHVCQVSKWNCKGLRFYRGSNFPFFLLILNGPYNSAALVRCLWYSLLVHKIDDFRFSCSVTWLDPSKIL